MKSEHTPQMLEKKLRDAYLLFFSIICLHYDIISTKLNCNKILENLCDSSLFENSKFKGIFEII